MENLPRILPDDTQAHIDLASWSWPNIFSWLQDKGNISKDSMFETFNLGVGMLMIVRQQDLHQALNLLAEQGEKAWHIGQVQPANHQSPRVILD